MFFISRICTYPRLIKCLLFNTVGLTLIFGSISIKQHMYNIFYLFLFINTQTERTKSRSKQNNFNEIDKTKKKQQQNKSNETSVVNNRCLFYEIMMIQRYGRFTSESRLEVQNVTHGHLTNITHLAIFTTRLTTPKPVNSGQI